MVEKELLKESFVLFPWKCFAIWAPRPSLEFFFCFTIYMGIKYSPTEQLFFPIQVESARELYRSVWRKIFTGFCKEMGSAVKLDFLESLTKRPPFFSFNAAIDGRMNTWFVIILYLVCQLYTDISDAQLGYCDCDSGFWPIQCTIRQSWVL